MAYNYPVYQPMYTQTYPNYQSVLPSNNSQNSGIIWVQGEQAAKSYLVAPNNTVQLWDSEKQVIYLKSADGSGMPSMKVLDYTVREEQNAATSTTEPKYAMKSDIDGLSARLDELRAELDVLSAKKRKKGEEDV